MKQFLVVCGFVLSGVVVATACDLCSVYSPQKHREPRVGLYAGVFEQFTDFETLQDDGAEIFNGAGQFLESSITQLLAGWQVNPRLAVQFSAPVFNRSFRRAEGVEIEEGTESGLGDVAMLASVRVYERESDDVSAWINLLAGVKFPTGNSDRLAEEAAGHHHEEEHEDHSYVNGVHEHDLALGSGSFDGIVGASGLVRRHQLFLAGTIQYAIRSEGDFNYQFANDLRWSAGPGVYVARDQNGSVGLMLTVSGETKGEDKINDQSLDDSAATFVYLGPELVVNWRDRLSVDFAIDLPVYRDNSAVQLVPDVRFRAAATWRF